MAEVNEAEVYKYVDVMCDALSEKEVQVSVVEAALGCLILASRFLAMLDKSLRDEIVAVVEDDFRGDVEAQALHPLAKVGVAKLQ